MTPANSTLTRRVLSFIRAYDTANGYPPLTNEIASALGVSQGVVLRRLWRAAGDGDLTYKPHTPRTWKLTANGERKVAR